MPLTIRPATENDQPAIRRLIAEVRLPRMNLQWPNFVVAEEDREMVGMGQVKSHGDGSRELASIAVLPLPLREDGDRCQFTASVAVRLDLAHADHLSVLLSHHEIGPLKVHPRQTYLGNEASDCRLVVLGRGTDGERHPGGSRLSRGPPTQPKECRTPPTPSSTYTTTPSTRCSMGRAASTRSWRLRPS